MADRDMSFKVRGLSPGVFAGLSKLFAVHPIVRSRSLASVEAYKSGTAAVILKAFNPYYSSLITAQGFDRYSRYMDYQEMDGVTPECAAALDLYADEACLENEQKEIVSVVCGDEKIREQLEEFLYERLNIRANLWHWVRNACKYGDYVLLNNIVEGEGITNVFPIPVNEFSREEGYDAKNPFAIRYRWQARANQEILPWEVTHFRLLGKDVFCPFGTSVLESARRVWRQLVLAEDSMLTYRVVRAPERRVFYIEMGATPPEAIDNAMEQAINKLKQQNIADNVGRVEKRFNPMDVMTDYFLPKRGDVSSRIDSLPGGSMVNDIDDIIYLQCLRGVTQVALTDGTTCTMVELAGLDLKKTAVYTTSIDPVTRKKTSARIVGACKTRKNASYVKVVLDNDEFVEATPDHRFLLSNGEYCEAMRLKAGDNLMTLSECHQVKYIGSVDVVEDAYDIQVDNDFSNFALACGIFVHNSKMISALHIPKAFLGMDEALCLHPTTEVPLLDGRVLPIEQIAKEFVTNKDMWVYSYDAISDSFVPGLIADCKKTRLDAELVEVVLDNGKSVKCTPDHHFVLRGGAECEAQLLKPDDSLQACYRRHKKISNIGGEYEQILQPSTGKWEWTHKIVEENLNGPICNEGKHKRNEIVIIHHKNFNRLDNGPDNLRRMTKAEHSLMHSELSKRSIAKRFADNPDAKLRLSRQWQARTFEERSAIVKKSYIGADARRAARSERNRALGLAAKLHEGYEKAFPNGRPDLQGPNSVKWVERPSVESMIAFIKSYTDLSKVDTIDKLAHELGHTTAIIIDALRKEGWPSSEEFLNEYVGFKAGRGKGVRRELLEGWLEASKDLNDLEVRFGLGKMALKTNLRKYDMTLADAKDMLGANYNHKVVEVRTLAERSDTYNLSIEDRGNNHNFICGAEITLKNSGKATLAGEDVRWSRTVQRVQQQIAMELTRVAMIHLYSCGYTEEDDLLDFELHMTNPSSLAELQKMEVWARKLEVADRAPEAGLPERWIHEHLFGFSDEEFEINRKERISDAKFKAELEKAGGAGSGEEGGGFGSEEGAPMGGEESFTNPEERFGSSAAETGESAMAAAASGNKTLDQIMQSIIDPISDHQIKAGSTLSENQNRHMDLGWRKSLIRELKSSGTQVARTILVG